MTKIISAQWNRIYALYSWIRRKCNKFEPELSEVCCSGRVTVLTKLSPKAAVDLERIQPCWRRQSTHLEISGYTYTPPPFSREKETIRNNILSPFDFFQYTIKQFPLVIGMPCESADSIPIKSLSMWVLCGPIDLVPLMWLLILLLVPKKYASQ